MSTKKSGGTRVMFWSGSRMCILTTLVRKHMDIHDKCVHIHKESKCILRFRYLLLFVYVYLHVHKSTHVLFCVLFVRSIHVHNACVYTCPHSCSVECADEQNRQYHCSHHSPVPPMTWEDDAPALGIKSSSEWSWPRDSGEESSPGHTNWHTSPQAWHV